MSMVIDGVADLGIGVKLDSGHPKKINFLEWKSFDKMLITRKDHPLAQKKNITLSNISAYPLIVYRDGTIMRADVEGAFVRNDLPFEIIMEMDVSENIKKYVEMGIGISVLSSLTLTNADNKTFFLSNVNHLFNNKIEYVIYYRKDKYITTPMKNFINIYSPELLHNVGEFGTLQNGLKNLERSGILLP
jgi:DNA-binding transcriptional LysR family regulator